MFSVPENQQQTASLNAENGSAHDPKVGKGGRPALPDSERRTHRIGVNVNAAERAIIEAKAEAVGLSVGVYLRQAGVGARLSSRVNDRVYHQLSRIGVNVNQMARVANTTGRLPELEKLQTLLAQILEMREQV